MCGARARELIEIHQLQAGLKVKISLFEEGLGMAEIISTNFEAVELSYQLSLQNPERENLHLIAAVARPQTLKKILHLAASHGIKKVSFIKAENTEKSYLQSKALEANNIAKEMQLAIEQSFDCFLPQVLVYKTYREFMQQLPQAVNFQAAYKILADVPRISESGNNSNTLLQLSSPNQEVILAIGPEAGWVDKEREDFLKGGFLSYSLGKRIYRAEHALGMLFGQIAHSRVLR